METKKQALRGVRFGALTRIVACVLTVVLVAGMVPSSAIAYAADGNNGNETPQNTQSTESTSASSDRINEDVALDTSGSASDEGTNVAESEDSASVSQDVSEGADTSASANAGGSSNKYTGSTNGQTSADVVLGSEAAVGTIEYNGLAYTINTDDPDTVSVTGIASNAPKGDLVIPSQIASGNKLYTVAKIVAWGGVLR